jgi:outer membrane protein OmpA-like peptidoglycan-associated protein
VNRTGSRDKDGYPTDRRVDIVVIHEKSKTVVRELPRENPSMAKERPRRDTPAAVHKVVLADLSQIAKLKAGATIVLDNVYFPPDRHILKPESYPALEKLYKTMDANPSLKISIEGHVCCITDAPDAFDIDTGEPILSVNRAKAIYDYLVGKGIEESRLSYEGFGRSRPVVEHEQDEADAEKNRRVEIRVIDNK